MSCSATTRRCEVGARPRPRNGSVEAMSRAALDKDPRDVASMFDGVARKYDLTNTVLSLGQDRYWRRATRSALRIGPGQRSWTWPRAPPCPP